MTGARVVRAGQARLYVRILVLRAFLRTVYPIDCVMAVLASVLGVLALMRPDLILVQSRYERIGLMIPYFGTIAIVGSVVAIGGVVGNGIVARRLGAFVCFVPVLTMFLATGAVTGHIAWGFYSLIDFALFAIL